MVPRIKYLIVITFVLCEFSTQGSWRQKVWNAGAGVIQGSHGMEYLRRYSSALAGSAKTFQGIKNYGTAIGESFITPETSVFSVINMIPMISGIDPAMAKMIIGTTISLAAMKYAFPYFMQKGIMWQSFLPSWFTKELSPEEKLYNAKNEMFTYVEQQFKKMMEAPDEYLTEENINSFVTTLFENYQDVLRVIDKDGCTLLGKTAQILNYFVKKAIKSSNATLEKMNALDTHDIYMILDVYIKITALGIKTSESVTDKTWYAVIGKNLSKYCDAFIKSDSIGLIPLSDMIMFADIMGVIKNKIPKKVFYRFDTVINQLLIKHPHYSADDVYHARKIMDYNAIMIFMHTIATIIDHYKPKFEQQFNQFLREKQQQAQRVEEAKRLAMQHKELQEFEKAKRTFCELLHIDEQSSHEHIKKAYRIKIQKMHPDVLIYQNEQEKNRLKEKIKTLNAAYTQYDEAYKKLEAQWPSGLHDIIKHYERPSRE